MVFIVIPLGRRRVVLYSCPYCHRREKYFFSLLPVLKPEWRCKGCKKTFKMNAACIGSNWAGVFALWSAPLTWVATATFLVLIILVQAHKGPVPMTLGRLLLSLLGSVICVGPVFALMMAPIFGLLGFLVGLFYGLFATNRPGMSG